MKKLSLLLFIIFIPFSPFLHSQDSKIIFPKDSLAELVKNEFLHSWKAYKKYAWGHDESEPVSRTAYDWYGTSFLMI